LGCAGIQAEGLKINWLISIPWAALALPTSLA
jgi:hypothetical protein